MNEDLEDFSGEMYNSLWPEAYLDDVLDHKDDSYDDWLFTLSNLFGGF